MKTLILPVIVSALLLFVPALHAGNPDSIIGKWCMQNRSVEIEVYKVNGVYNGKISRLKDPNYPANDPREMGGRPRVDRENPDPSKRNRPLIGMEILWGFHYTGDNIWEQGTVYDPLAGKQYKGKLTFESPDKLKVRGFVGVSIFGRTLTFTKSHGMTSLQ